jgi:hypothetical protein
MDYPTLAFLPAIGPFELLAILVIAGIPVVGAIVTLIVVLANKRTDNSPCLPPPLPRTDEGDNTPG